MRARVVGLLAGAAALTSAGAAAHSAGITGYSGNPAINSGATCTTCHSGGSYNYNLPAISGATSVVAGTLNSYTLNFTKAAGTDAVRAGFDMSATGGTLSDPNTSDPSVKKVGAELTHGTPRVPSSGNFSWSFDWTAPSPGTYTFRVCNNPVNLNGANTGDGAIRCSATDITVTQAAPTPPVANNDSYTAPKDGTLNVAAAGVLANDTDINGDTLTAVLGNGTTHGVLTLNDNGSFSYTPEIGFTGSDGFTYQAFDGSAASNAATVTILVMEPGGGGGGGAPAPTMLAVLALAALQRLTNRLRRD